MRKLRLREVPWLVQGHEASKWPMGSWGMGRGTVCASGFSFLPDPFSSWVTHWYFQRRIRTVHNYVMLGWVPGADESIVKIYDQPAAQRVLEDEVGTQLSYYTGQMAWALIHNVCTFPGTLSAIDTWKDPFIRRHGDLPFNDQESVV